MSLRYPLLGAAIGAAVAWLAIEVALAPEVEEIEIQYRWAIKETPEFEQAYGMCA